MSNDDFRAKFLPDKDKCTLTEQDLFDRVINLKLYVSDGNGELKDTYVIRSDYEAYYPSLMESIAENNYSSFTKQKCVIRKCQHKPSIKVQYKRVSLSTAVEVDIFVHNFYMLDKNGDLIYGFNNSTYKLSRVDFAMGYFGQFKALFSDKTPASPSELVSMGFADDSDPDFYSNPSVGHGITVMTIGNVMYTQMDRLPPDGILHIHGYVGNIFAPKVGGEASNFPKKYDEIMKSQAVIPASYGKSDTFLENLYYQAVTRNFVAKGTPTTLKSTTVAEGKDYVTGVMSDEDAEKWGIKVYLSAGAKDYSKNMVEGRLKKDKDGNIIESQITIPKAGNAKEKINKIANQFKLEGFTSVFIDSYGAFLICLESELSDLESALADTTVEEVYKKSALAVSWDNKIPAVYNITTDALCTITCPFFCFINPFEKLTFKSRYALGGLVSYYANFTAVTKNEFYALWQNISFATVEEVNECMIVCTGQKKEE